MRPRLPTFLLVTALAAAAAQADPAVEGDAHQENTVLKGIAAPPVRALGADALRFSTEPQLGGRAIVVETVRSSGGRHPVRVRRFNGHFREGWTADGEWTFRISDQEYDRLTSRLDALLAQRDPQPNCQDVEENECMYICTDGPGILVERAVQGRSIWRRGSCGPRHPNDIAAEAIEHLVRRHLGLGVFPRS